MGATKFPLVPPPQGGKPSLQVPGQPGPMRPDEFAPGSIPNIATFSLASVTPPSPLYIQRDDQIFIRASSSLADTVTVNIRMLQAPVPRGGQPDKAAGSIVAPVDLRNTNVIVVETETVSVPATRSSADKLISIGEGYLLSAAAVSSQAQFRGQTFVQLLLVRGGVAYTNVRLVLFADYVTQSHATTWPFGRVAHPSEGVGWTHSIQIPNPGAGLDWAFTAATFQRVRVVSLEAQLAVANSGAARPVEIVVDDGVNVVARMATNAAAPINATANMNFSSSGTPPTSVASDLYAQMPATLVLQPAWRMRSVTTNIVAGDTWTNIWFAAEELQDGG